MYTVHPIIARFLVPPFISPLTLSSFVSPPSSRRPLPVIHFPLLCNLMPRLPGRFVSRFYHLRAFHQVNYKRTTASFQSRSFSPMKRLGEVTNRSWKGRKDRHRLIVRDFRVFYTVNYKRMTTSFPSQSFSPMQ